MLFSFLLISIISHSCQLLLGLVWCAKYCVTHQCAIQCVPLCRTTHTRLPQGSCLSPSLFNLYMLVVACALEGANISCIIYGDDIVIFHVHKYINHSSNLLNHSLGVLDTELNQLHFSVALQKSKVVVFTRKWRFVLLPPSSAHRNIGTSKLCVF